MLFVLFITKYLGSFANFLETYYQIELFTFFRGLTPPHTAQSMIAPLSMLDELLDPPMMFAQPISSASPNNSSAGVSQASKKQTN